ncbi:MAG: hypothetical protein CM1200mP20_05870 [Pseudomonadota bacterium]|nr:MAG: hypothetical protein CM1200mP20_05870 [Pseudomonadota bacterium]
MDFIQLFGGRSRDIWKEITVSGNHFAWFGADREFDTLTQTFIDTPYGPMNSHHYSYAPGRSTFIIEMNSATFKPLASNRWPQWITGRNGVSICSRAWGRKPYHQQFGMAAVSHPQLSKLDLDDQVLVGDALQRCIFRLAQVRGSP